MKKLTTRILLLGAMLAAGPVWAVNKCTGSYGQTIYQEAPCAGSGITVAEDVARKQAAVVQKQVEDDQDAPASVTGVLSCFGVHAHFPANTPGPPPFERRSAHRRHALCVDVDVRLVTVEVVLGEAFTEFGVLFRGLDVSKS